MSPSVSLCSFQKAEEERAQAAAAAAASTSTTVAPQEVPEEIESVLPLESDSSIEARDFSKAKKPAKKKNKNPVDPFSNMVEIVDGILSSSPSFSLSISTIGDRIVKVTNRNWHDTFRLVQQSSHHSLLMACLSLFPDDGLLFSLIDQSLVLYGSSWSHMLTSS